MFVLHAFQGRRRCKVDLFTVALIWSLACLFSATPLLAAGRTLTAKYVSDSLTANCINTLAEDRALHERDIQIADDNHRQIEEASEQKLAAAKARVSAAIARNAQLRQATDRERALRLQAGQELAAARDASQ